MADRPQVSGWQNINLNKPEEYSSEFTKDGLTYANVTNVTTGQRQLYFVSGLPGTPITQRSLLSTTNSDGKVTVGVARDDFIRQFGKDKLAAAEKANKQQSVKLLSTPGLSTKTELANIKNSKEFKSSNIGNNAATKEENEAAKNKAELEKELDEKTRRERKSYDPLLVYPEKLQLEYQDCIKISMLRYQQSGLSSKTTSKSLGTFNRSVSVNKGAVPTVGDRKILTTIVLPIPGGINDSNPVDWQGDSLDEISKAFALVAQQTITEGGGGLQKAGEEVSGAAQKNIKGLQATFASKMTQAATGTSGIMQRQYGAVTNPNLELLFKGPQLRTFSFIFRLSPRSTTEAKTVQKIIRYFKQGMTPKRSDGYLLLQSPHTFAISYLTSNKQHPYLNKFKECALTQCNVNYTPEGNYMSFDGKVEERSMTSYELTLQFQELVPLFDDDYGLNDTDIGF